LALVLAFAAAGQTANWRKVGSSDVELMLASPATGPVDTVWFGGDGRLFARTHSGKTFETTDFEIWLPSANPPAPPVPVQAQVSRLPEAGAHVVGASFGRAYALGKNLFRSDDAGLTWNNLTGFKAESVIGAGQRSVAVGPNDQIIVANDYGVWRSMDSGQSWAGLNDGLPNLPVRRILATPQGTSGTRVVADGLGAIELQPGSNVWRPAEDNAAAFDANLLRYFSGLVRADIRSYRVAGPYTYLGGSDGRIWVSANGAAPQLTDSNAATGAVEKIFADPGRPQVALAAVGGESGSHVLRTTNGGVFWDVLDGNLPGGAVHGITAEQASGAVYVATDKGVFWTRTDLDQAGTASPNWTSLNEGLPAGEAKDVQLDAAGVQLYAALDGYGVYAAAAPHRARNLRLVNSADFSARPAAPGGLLSVVGARVSSASGGQLNYPVLAAADDASQIQVPFEASGPNVTLALVTNTGPVQIGMRVQPVSPAIFVTHDGAPLLQDADTGLLLDSRNGAKGGARVQILATGLGKVNPDWLTGTQAPLENPPTVAASMRAFLNGTPIPVTRATLAPGYIGFYQVEVQLPAINNAGVNELYITAGGAESNRVPIVIQQ
jgi:uncharacterized protein (TIGR03437 family)